LHCRQIWFGCFAALGERVDRHADNVAESFVAKHNVKFEHHKEVEA
jgi:hypothetical protein